MGYRAAEVAMRELGLDIEKTEDEELVCVAENDACGIDSIQQLLSCTLGKGNLIIRLRGKPAYSFFDRRTGKKVRIVAKPFDRDCTKEKAIDHFLNDPVPEVFNIKIPGYDIPERAKIFDSVQCECCGESAREDLIRLHNGKKLCLDCFDEYRPRYE